MKRLRYARLLIRTHRVLWFVVDETDFKLQLSSLAIDEAGNFWTLTEKGPYLLEVKLHPDRQPSINAFDVGTNAVNTKPGSNDGYEGVDVINGDDGQIHAYVITDHGSTSLIGKDNKGNWNAAEEVFVLSEERKDKLRKRHPKYEIDGQWEGIAAQVSAGKTSIWVCHEAGKCKFGNRGSLLLNLQYDPKLAKPNQVRFSNSWEVDLQEMLARSLIYSIDKATRIEFMEATEGYVRIGKAINNRCQKHLDKKRADIDKRPISNEEKIALKEKARAKLQKQVSEKFYTTILAPDFRICALEIFNDQLWALASWHRKVKDKGIDEGRLWLINLGDPSKSPDGNPVISSFDWVKVPDELVDQKNWEGLAMYRDGQKTHVILISDDAQSSLRWDNGRPRVASSKTTKPTYMLHLELTDR